MTHSDHAGHGDHDGHGYFAELLELDAEVLGEQHREVTAWVAARVPGRPHIIDLGAGTGAGALAFARELPEAEITAVDVSAELLDRLRHKAIALGLGGRVATVQADLDEGWPELRPADLVWAANSMHHVAEPGAALARARDVLRPGGLLAVSELSAFPRFLTDAAGAALEERGNAAMAAVRAEAGMHLDADWAALLGAAGLDVEAERRFDADLRPPLPAVAGRYARASLAHLRRGLDGRLSPADLAALDAAAAAAPTSPDLTIRASRTVWLARRPWAAVIG
jgi:SAM-dependent methyltransferase